ncbi:MAG: ABC transporter permease [Anaerovoracaceae bacterium]|jgi:putative ABC transport system permease protein
MLKENFLMSWENIINNKMRSFLTALGIVIGVTAIIALITIMESVTDEVMSQFESLGTGKLSITAYGTPLKQGLNARDINELENLDNVAGVAPTVSLNGTAAKQGTLIEDIAIQGKSELYFDSLEDPILKGRALTHVDMSGYSYVTVIDDVLAKNMFLNEDPIGQKILLNGRSYEVVGVSDSDIDDMTVMLGGVVSSDEGVAIIPYKNALRLSGAANVTNLEVYLEDSALANETTDNIELALDSAFNYKDNSYMVLNLESLVEMMETMNNMFTTLLAGIASIALVVGGIGIMNMMLVSVTERTKEIGLRKALGAEPRQIQVQFIIEAIVLSLTGGILGIMFGLALSYAAALALDTAFVISWGAIILGAGFSFAVGIVFGWAPAKKASGLKPIDALRSE